MKIKKIPSGPLQTNSYVVGQKRAVIIDAAPGVYEELVAYCIEDAIAVSAILITHGHWDHIADLSLLKEHFKVAVMIHEKDAFNLQKPLFSRIAITPVKEFSTLKDGAIIPVDDSSLKVLHTPGHSPGCCSFYNADEKLLFCGDTLFKGSFGRVDLPQASAEDTVKSLDMLVTTLPQDTAIFPGHGANSTLGIEAVWINKKNYL